MKVIIETEWLTIIVQMFYGTRSHFSHAVLVPKLTGEALGRAAKP